MVGNSTYVANTLYNASGQVELQQLGLTSGNDKQLTLDYSYYPWDGSLGQGNSQGRLKQLMITSATSPLTVLQNLTYTYDKVGNISTILDAVNSNQKQCFDYDTLNRLTSAVVGINDSSCSGAVGNGEYTDESYSYDSATGNLASKTGMGTYTYPGATQPRPHAVTSTTTGWSYAYDANGNMTHRAQQEADYYDFVYDAANRLSQAKKNGSLVAKFTYDGDGKRVKSEGAYKNLAAGVVATSPSGVSSPGRITDGSLATGFAQTGGTGLSYVQLDLGAVYTVDKVKVWHYYSDGRTYHNTKTQVSADGVTWTTVFDSATSGEYAETSAGKTHTFSGQGGARRKNCAMCAITPTAQAAMSGIIGWSSKCGVLPRPPSEGTRTSLCTMATASG